ncbi:MAG: iron ABC transporter permease, partial [Candidatus Methanomethylophilaceae archaeon]|nr:iron ABC transporter permease [Candidatus Methanomethylophilaceae archaeon]
MFRHIGDGDGTKAPYIAFLRRQRFVCLAFLVLAVVAVIVLYGFSNNASQSYWTSYAVLGNHLFGFEAPPGKFTDMVFWDRLLPRAINAAFVGGALAIAGCVMQIVFRNPLADPYTTGISSGAGFGATIAIAMGISLVPGLTGDWAIVLNAFILSLVPTFAMLAVMMFRKSSPSELILVGIGIMYFFGAASTVFMLWANPSDLSGAFRWGLGHLESVGWANMPLIIGATVLGSAAVLLMSERLNVMNAGDRGALTMGEDPNKVRFLCLLLTSMMVAVVVAFTGTIGFVGIVAPHVVRLTMGTNTRYMLLGSFAVGAVLLVASDALAKVMALPVGVIMSVVGGPLFLFILVKQYRREH